MLRFVRYIDTFLAIFFLLLQLPHCFPARKLPDPLTELTVVDIDDNKWRGFINFLDLGKGSQVAGMSELKKYFHRFGYLPVAAPEGKLNFTDLFDEELESAVLRFQKNLGLTATGKLDTDTVKEIMLPRCGNSDDYATPPHAVHATRNYAYFYGRPRWRGSPPKLLTYAFSPENMIEYIPMREIKTVFRKAFSRWSAVIPVNFTEADDYPSADIKIGFYYGNHGDGEPFDGVLGILAHAFSPENGRFHLDAAETWAVDFDQQKSRAAVDLESVATHEIGHILGLAHSSVKEAIMYPSLSPRTKKVGLRVDDVEGIQALYGSNPNFKYSSLLSSDISSGWSNAFGKGTSSKWTTFLVVLVFTLFFCL